MYILNPICVSDPVLCQKSPCLEFSTWSLCSNKIAGIKGYLSYKSIFCHKVAVDV